MKYLLALTLAGLAGGCTIDQTLSDIRVAAPIIRGAATTIACVAAPGAEQIAGAVEAGAAPSLSTLNDLAIAGTQVACQRLTTPVRR